MTVFHSHASPHMERPVQVEPLPVKPIISRHVQPAQKPKGSEGEQAPKQPKARRNRSVQPLESTVKVAPLAQTPPVVTAAPIASAQPPLQAKDNRKNPIQRRRRRSPIEKSEDNLINLANSQNK